MLPNIETMPPNIENKSYKGRGAGTMCYNFFNRIAECRKNIR